MEYYPLFCLQYGMENEKYLHFRRAMIAQVTPHLGYTCSIVSGRAFMQQIRSR